MQAISQIRLQRITETFMSIAKTAVVPPKDGTSASLRGANSGPTQSLHYRPDIDGLRAIAVLSVLAYHLKMGLFSGGFVGVDIFFVISGYLISADHSRRTSPAGKFSIAAFYERRVRRIFPALIATLLGTSVLAYLFFLPAELMSFAKSLLAALFSVSNFYFWKHSGYFSAPVETMPLVHTWSLAVEEQFYVFLPIFLVSRASLFPAENSVFGHC